MSDTYTISYSCDNCSVPTPMSFAKGTPAPETVECGNCGCRADKKKQTPHGAYGSKSRVDFLREMQLQEVQRRQFEEMQRGSYTPGWPYYSGGYGPHYKDQAGVAQLQQQGRQ